MNRKTVQQLLLPIAIIFLGVFLRLVPHPANMAPITAMALFGGIYLPRKYAIIIPLSAMFFSDIVLGFHSTMLFVYGSFLLIGSIGIFLKTYKSINTVLFASIFSSVLFFIITNF